MDKRTLELEQNGDNGELEQFLYAVSHDLRAPLRQLQGYTDLLVQDLKKEATEATDKIHEDIDYIQSSTNRVQMMLDGLLTLSRVTRAEIEGQVELEGCVKEAVDSLSEFEGDDVDWEIETPLGTVEGDRGLMILLYQNLLENAVKYSGELPVVIRIGRTQKGGAETWYVRAQGMGIDPEYLENVFAVFEELNPATPGSRLGLAICRRTINCHGGRTWIESETGNGTTVYFTLHEEGDSNE